MTLAVFPATSCCVSCKRSFNSLMVSECQQDITGKKAALAAHLCRVLRAGSRPFHLDSRRLRPPRGQQSREAQDRLGFSIWVQSGSIIGSRDFLTTPKVAASAVECQSVTAKCDLDTVEVRSSSLLVPAISLPDESGRGGRLRGASSLFGPDWRASYVRIEIPAMALLRRK